MDINWIDQTSTVQGTPVNRARLMGMQGFLALNGTIVKSGNTVTITENNADFGVTETVIVTGAGLTRITKRFYPAGESTYSRVLTRLTKETSGNITILQTVGTFNGTYGG